MVSRREIIIAGGGGLVAAGGRAWATPAPMRLLLGFPSGGTVDRLARHLARHLEPVARVEPVIGGAGRQAVEHLMGASADGQTVLLGPSGPLTLLPHLPPSFTRDVTALTPVTTLALAPMGLAVGPRVPRMVDSLGALVHWLGRQQGQSLSYGSPAPGSVMHFMGQQFVRQTGVSLVHAPYRGGPSALRDLIDSQLAFHVGPLGDFLAHHGPGRVRVMAVSGLARSRFFPEVPTFAEQGFAGFEHVGRLLVMMPPAAAEARVHALARQLQAQLAEPDCIAMLDALAMTAHCAGPDELRATLQREHAAWRVAVARTGFDVST